MGQIITFYSYKGGVGRTFALANIAAQLSLWGYKVLVVDWDLEAPGLHHYFGSFLIPPLPSGVLCDRPGLLEYFEAWEKDSATDWQSYTRDVRLPGASGPLKFISASRQTPDYGPRARRIPWETLYRQHGLGDHLSAVAGEWREAYDFIFIDSRTGLSDTAGICTVQLPDIVAFVLTASYQSVSGTAHAAARMEEARAESPYSRSLPYQLPIVSRFAETEEVDLAKIWRGIIAAGVDDLFQAWCPVDTTVASLVEVLKLPHISRWTYGEELPVLTEWSPGDPFITNNTQLISYHIQTIAAVLAHRLDDIASLVRDRSGYVSRAAQRAVVRPGSTSDSSEQILAFLGELEKKAFEASARGDRIEALAQYREILAKAETAFGSHSGPVLNAALSVARMEQNLVDPLQRYYQNLREQFANYDNVGLPVTAREGKEEREQPIKIRDLFVLPHCSAQHIRPVELDAAVREGKELGEPLLPLLEKPGARIVLLGDPGMGKSTVVQYLVATLADGKAPAGAAGLRGAIPFPFVLRELARLLPEDVKMWNWDALLDAFCRWDPRSYGEGPLAAHIADRATFRLLVGSDKAFFLIDGFDEIGDLAKRIAIRDAIWEGFAIATGARWLITSRIVGYDGAEAHSLRIASGEPPPLLLKAIHGGSPRGSASHDFSKTALSLTVKCADLLYLAPFSDAQQQAFAAHWYGPRMGDVKGVARAREFVDAVHQHPDTRVIGRIPNLLYLLALLYRHQAHLPSGRVLIYEAISEAYLESIPLQRRLLGEAAAFDQSFPEKEQLLAIVGIKMQQMRASLKEGMDGDILVSREQLAEWLGPHFASVAELDDFLRHVARHSGLLLPRGEGVYGFAYRSFQEYYAACLLQSDFGRMVAAGPRTAAGPLRRTAPEKMENEERLFAEYAALPVWHESLIFLAEKFRASGAYTTQLLEWMFPQLADDPARGMDWMPVAAARLLATLSIDPEVALDLEQRRTIWQALWRAQSAAADWQWMIATSLVVAGSSFQGGVLQAAADIEPKRLNLSDCLGLSDLAPLAGLTGLQLLNLSNCTGLDDLTPLAGLIGLQSLDLTGCTGLVDLGPLARLIDLKTLYLDDCTALTIEAIAELREALPNTKIDS